MNVIEKNSSGIKCSSYQTFTTKDMNFSILKAIIGINILGADKDIE